ncbi:hypothetical protein [Rhodoferax saidenbachensis]|uniref:Uncharacterized protein n=1 Tax=Rhodoferax saidenbachensis TaxID=1484693 RepID=A0A1P8KB24_9BURK|nr:hypothetical protein [Rhodoferax saidenbachensis]APW43197.1 hypothetical protein RS694_12120 [Rhodoferax saidenbachensis]
MLEQIKRGLQRMLHVGEGAALAPTQMGLIPVEEIRHCLLECLGELGSARYPAVERRIWLENHVAGLWCLRADLMAALSDLYGEVVALEKLRQVTPLFAGHVPQAAAFSVSER